MREGYKNYTEPAPHPPLRCGVLWSPLEPSHVGYAVKLHYFF
jgi:hypothetical protein